MGERQDIERRLRTLSDVGDIMAALKNAAIVEATRLRKLVPAQQRVVRTVKHATEDFLSHYPQPWEMPPGAPEVVLLLGSERGFCGDYNDAVISAYVRRVPRTQSAPLIVAVGRRLATRLGETAKPAAVLEAPSVAEEVHGAITRLVAALENLPVPQGALLLPALSVFAHEVVGHASEVRETCPFRALSGEERRFAEPPRLYLDPFTLFRELTDHYLFAILHELFYSALLAENERRLQHLEGALHRIDRKREELTLRRYALRQEEITEEIEIILLSAGPNIVESEPSDGPQ